MLPDSRRSPRFAGLVTFARYPRLEDVEPAHKPVDWAIYGVPYDAGVTYRPGARFGPRAIRNESQYVKRYSIEHDVDVTAVLSLADAGDAPVAPYHPKENAMRVAEWGAALDGGAKSHQTKLFALGGDHSIAYANLRATWERQGKPKGGLALLHFDAHLDTVDQVWDEKWGHASPFIRAIEDGLVDPKRMLSVGIRGPLNTRDDLAFAKKHGVTILTYDQWSASHREGNAEIRAFVDRLAGAPTYLTFDIDCVDPAFAPGTGTPCVGGFTSAEALSAVRACAGVNIIGADVVEVLPDRDVAGITSLLAGHIAMEILAIDAKRCVQAASSHAAKSHRKS
jgi:agmatinase